LDGLRKRVLHVAPEFEVKRRLERFSYLDYFSASLSGVGTRIQLDINSISFPADYFHVIYCSHVLEHVLEDRKAMREFHRVLKPEGWALLQVPIAAGLEKTFEDPSVVDPKERERLFEQEDHVRLYGADYSDRLREAGFCVKVLHGIDLIGNNKATRWGIDPTEDIFFCRKSQNGDSANRIDNRAV